MYVPARFSVTDPETAKAFIREHSFGTLTSWDGVRPLATHVPLLLDEGADKGPVLQGHMSRENPQWKTFNGTTEVLAVFHGPHTYISAGWYKGHGVPTWNYMAVHAYGLPRIIDGRELYAVLDALVRRQESRYGSGTGYDLSGLPEGYVTSMMKGIVGFTIALTRIEASFKLSQNTDPGDYQKVIGELRRRGDADSLQIAEEMSRRPARPPA